jgi:hypothetical protein
MTMRAGGIILYRMTKTADGIKQEGWDYSILYRTKRKDGFTKDHVARQD